MSSIPHEGRAMIAARHPVRTPPTPWAQVVVYGVLWGVAAVGSETVFLPIEAVTDHYGDFFLSLGITQSVLGIGIAAAAVLIERRFSRFSLVLAAIATSLVFVSLQQVLQRVVYPWIGLSVYPVHADLATTFLYNLWVALFYGSLLFVGRVLAMRADRTERLLGDAEIDRHRSETLLGETQLQALQGRVDPALLHDVMSEVLRRHAAEPAGAQRLLDELVAFLRAAMPSLQAGPSTLGAEIALARAYAAMWGEYAPQRRSWAIHADTAVGALPFPALLLLPVLDVLAAASDHAGRGEMAVVLDPARDRVSLRAQASCAEARFDGALLTRLRIGLRALYGAGCSLQVGHGTLQIELTVLAAFRHLVTQENSHVR